MNDPISILPSKAGNDTKFSGKYRDAIFSGKMIRYYEDRHHKKYDPIQSYDLNSDGYRGPDLAKGTDLVFAGCSFTYGMGVPENGIWGSMVANRLGLTYNNISISGASIPWIVKQLFAYFSEYGNPKTLMCLFPQLERTFFPSNPEILKSKNNVVEKSTEDIFSEKSIFNIDLASILQNQTRPQYSKRPHDIEDIMSSDFLVYISMQNIRMLEQYCKASGINFLWGSWSNSFCDFMERPGGLLENYEFDGYVRTEYKMWKHKTGSIGREVFWETAEARDYCKSRHSTNPCECSSSCHQEILEQFEGSFYGGTDTLKGNSHFGVHRHAHFADSFVDALHSKLESSSDGQP